MGWLWDFYLGAAVYNSGFQFHYGMIVSVQAEIDAYSYLISIPLWDDCEHYWAHPHTNDTAFQFHYGMIVRKSMHDMLKQYVISIPLWDDCELTPANKLVYASQISIPLWDDCENTIGCYSNFAGRFQFHYGMIVRLYKDDPDENMSKISIPLWDDCEILHRQSNIL